MSRTAVEPYELATLESDRAARLAAVPNAARLIRALEDAASRGQGPNIDAQGWAYGAAWDFAYRGEDMTPEAVAEQFAALGLEGK